MIHYNNRIVTLTCNQISQIFKVTYTLYRQNAQMNAKHTQLFYKHSLIAIILICIHSSFADTLETQCYLFNENEKACLLHQPAKRVISLIPHATEMVIAAAGQKSLIGATNHIMPIHLNPSIKKLGNGFNINFEELINLKPDLIIHWQKNQQMNVIQTLKIPIFISQPKSLYDIPKTIEKLGQALQTEKKAKSEAERFRQRLNRLIITQKIAQKNIKIKPKIFFQLSTTPLYTLNHCLPIYKQILQICGANNIFNTTIPFTIVGIEEVLYKNPDAIIAFSDGVDKNDLKYWERWPSLNAVRKNNLYIIESDIISRPGPRIIDGIETLCNIVNKIRLNMS